MPQDLLNLKAEDLEKLIQQAMGQMAGAAAGGPMPQAKPKMPALPSRIIETYGEPPISSAADYLDSLLERKEELAPRRMPAAQVPGTKRMIPDLAAMAPGAETPLAKAAKQVGGIEQGITAQPEAKPAAAGLGKTLKDIAAGGETIGRAVTGKGNVFVAGAEAASQFATGLAGFFVGVPAAYGKLLVDAVKGKASTEEANAFGEKVMDTLTFKPKTERGAALGEIALSPFAFLELLDKPGEILWPNNKEAQGSWKMATKLGLLAMGAYKKGAVPKWDAAGKVTASPVKPVKEATLKAYNKWYKERANDPTPPTVEEVKAKARELGIEEPIINTAEQMERNMEPRAEGAEGAVAPYTPAAPGTVIKTSDGTTITIAPPKAPVPPAQKAAQQRGAPSVIETAEGTIGQEFGAAPETAPAAKPAMGQVRNERRGEGEWKPQLRAIVDKAKKNETLSAQDLSILTGAADEIERLNSVAFTDELTGAPNRAALYRKYGRDIVVPKDQSIAVIDLGALKDINDKQGHAAGDKALSDVIKAGKSRGLEIYRTGGDEFTVVGETKFVNEKLSDLRQAAKQKASINIHYGVGKTFAEADGKMYEMKNGAPPSERRAAPGQPKPGAQPKTPAATANTFTHSESATILKQIEKDLGRDGFDQLAAGFGVDISGLKTTREIQLALGPELMKLERSQREIESVMRRGREDMGFEEQGANEVPPAGYEPGAMEKKYVWEEPEKPAPAAKPTVSNRAPQPRTPAAPVPEVGKAEKAPPRPSQPHSRADVAKLTSEESSKYDQYRPRPRDADGLSRWERDKKIFVAKAVESRLRRRHEQAGFIDVGMFGARTIADLYEKAMSGLAEWKGADKIAWLMNRYNQLSETARKSADPDAAGWDFYSAADAKLQAGAIQGAIRQAWQEMAGGTGRILVDIRAKTEEGRDAQKRISELQSRLQEIDKQYDDLTRGKPEYTTIKTEIESPEAKARKAAGMEVEQIEEENWSKTYKPQLARVSEGTYTPEGAGGEAARLIGEKVDITKQISDLEGRVGELEVVQEPYIEARPEVREWPEPIVGKEKKAGPTATEKKFYENLYTQEDWLDRAAKEARRRERKPEAKKLITSERMSHEQVYASMSLVEENLRKARARKQPIVAKKIMAGLPSTHPLYQPLMNALEAGDLKRVDNIISNARNRLIGYSAEEGAPYRESPAIEVGEKLPPTAGKPTTELKPGAAIGAREEGGPVQFYPQNPETQVKNQQQWRRSMKDMHKQEAPGLPGHFSEADQFPRLFPEAPVDARPDIVRRANRINDTAIEVVDRIIQEGIRERLSQEKIYLPSEKTMTEEGRMVREKLSMEERKRLPWGGATFEEAVAGKRADAWVKIFNRMKRDKSFGQLSQITDVVREHLNKSYKTQEEMYQAIAEDVRHLPIAKQIFTYTSRIKDRVLGERPVVQKGSPLEPWQIEQAVFDAYSDRLSGFQAEGGKELFSKALTKELEGMGMEEFGQRSGQLNHLALKIFAKKMWDEKYLNDYSGGNVVKKRAVEMMLKEGDSAPVAQYRLRQEFPDRYIPEKPERIAEWAGRRDPATGELNGYVKYFADKMDDWGPDAVRMWKRMSEGIEGAQMLTGGPVDSHANIMRIYFDPLLKRLDDLAGRKGMPQKVDEALEKRRIARESKATEEARLLKEKAEQEGKVAANPEDYNVIEVDEAESLAKKYPWEDDEGGSTPSGTTFGFMGGGDIQRFYEAAARGIRNYMRGLSQSKAERARELDTKAGLHKFGGQEVQERWEKGYRSSRNEPAGSAVGRFGREIKHSLTRIYTNLPNSPKYALFIDRLKWLEKEYSRSTGEALSVYNGDVLKEIDKQTSKLTRRKLEDTFSKKVFLDDMKEMYDGGAVEFAQGLTRETLPGEIEAFNRFLSEFSQVERDLVNGALDARKAAFEKVAGEIVAEGDRAGYNFRDIFSRKNYYRHELIVHYDRAIRGGKKMKPSTYSWGMKRRTEGYAGDLVTDVRAVDTEIIARLMYERDRLRVHNTVDGNYNIYDQIRAEADAKGLSEKEMYDKLIPEDYGLYYPDQNHLVYNAMTVSERLAKKILDSSMGRGEIKLTPGEVESIRKQMSIEEGGEGMAKKVIGPKRDPWIIPKDMITTLKEFGQAPPEPSWMATGMVKTLGYWKGWKLLGPKRIIKFQFRNMTGDAEMHAIGNPSTFTKVPAAIKMLKDYYRDGVASPEILEWIEKGGMDTTFHWAEIGDFQRLWKWSEKMGDVPVGLSKPVDALKHGWNTYADWAKRSSDLREGTLRLASYLDYRDQFTKNILNGKGERPNNYGASNRAFIDALPDVQTKSFWLSNELSGAYDLVSPLGRAARQSFVPFWSWKEITMKRYYRMLKNAAIDGKSAREIGGQFMRGAPYAALKVGKFIIKANAAMAILQAINHNAPALVGDPEAEEKLPLDVQSKPHITFGKGRYFSQVGAASDILDMLGMDIPSEMAVDFVKDLNKGKTPDLEAIAKKWWKDKPMVNHIFQSITPFIKTPADILYGKKSYPDLMNPRGIRDPFEYLADQVDVGAEYRMIKDRPGRDSAIKYAEKLMGYMHEENETAYFDWISTVNDFKKSQGSPPVSYSVSAKSNHLYYFKRARAEGDTEMANKEFKKFAAAAYLEGGYKGKPPEEIAKGIVQSIRQSYKEMFPLANLSITEFKNLWDTLPEKKRRILGRAMLYWRDILVGKDDAPGITAEIEEENQEE